jgi:hypothetical protein
MSLTANRGMGQTNYNGYSSDVAAVVDSVLSCNVYTAAGAISQKEGTVILKTGTAGAMTLANPTAGLPAAGGDDGKELSIVAADAHAYTVTTGTSGLNGASHIATFAAAIGNGITLTAYNGTWLVTVNNGITLS